MQAQGVNSGQQPAQGGRIASVEPGSLAARAGLRRGDVVVAINGRPLHDVLDYQFYAAEDRLALLVSREGLGDEEVTISMSAGGHLGLRFEEDVFDGIKRCNNRCAFCFVKQLPKGMRRSLYVKDDDYRYSVSYGSFITLTNLSADDWKRLEEQRLSPLRVSVHATDAKLRRDILGNPNAPDVLMQLRRLAELGLRAHVQLVLCPGWNDGDVLARSVADLAALYPTVQSVAAVPVGLGRQNRDPRLRLYGENEARRLVRDVSRWQRAFRGNLGIGFVYLADEFYFLAGRRFPSGRGYDGYPQYENGVGLVRSLLDEWANVRRLDRRGRLGQEWSGRRLTLACGERIAPLLRAIAGKMQVLTGLITDVVAVRNDFFGSSITVSGLLTGGDLLKALKGRALGDLVVLPRAMLDVGGQRFLDGLRPEDIETGVGRPVRFAGTLRGLLASVRQERAGQVA